MNRNLACLAAMALVAVATAADGAEAGPPAGTSQTRPAAGEDRLNIDLLKPLDGRGGYIRLEGRFLFLTGNVKDKQAGFRFDVEPDPSSPALLDKSLPGAWDVAVAGDYAFVCDYTKFLTVYDLRQRPWRQAARIDMPSMTENIVIRGKLAYVANHTAGLTIVDIADPAKPAIVSNFNPGIDCDGLALWNNCAVLYGHQESRLVLVNVSDPARPRQTGVYQHEEKSFNQGEVEVDGGFAFCTSVGGLVIVNVTDPTGPKLVKTAGPKGVVDVSVRDGYAFVAARAGGVRVLDVSDPAKAVEVGRYMDRSRLTASQLAVHKDAQAGRNAPASYYIYAANTASPAMILLFHAPARKDPPDPKERPGDEPTAGS